MTSPTITTTTATNDATNHNNHKTNILKIKLRLKQIESGHKQILSGMTIILSILCFRVYMTYHLQRYIEFMKKVNKWKFLCISTKASFVLLTNDATWYDDFDCTKLFSFSTLAPARRVASSKCGKDRVSQIHIIASINDLLLQHDINCNCNIC